MVKFRIASLCIGACLAAMSSANLTIAVASHIVDITDSNTSLREMTGSSTTSGYKILDVRCNYFSQMFPYDNGGVVDFVTGVHGYEGYVKVKWQGASPPDLDTAYSAIYQVWSLRYALSAANVMGTPAGRSLSAQVSVSNAYCTPLTVSSSATVGNPDYDVDGDCGSFDNIYSQALPAPTGTPPSSPPWHYMGNYVSSATFAQAGDGFYYAYVNMNGASTFTSAYAGYTPSIWRISDAATTQHRTRMIYKLLTVAGQDVD